MTGVLFVTLNGRPIEQYQHLVGTNGSLRADYITSSLTRLVGPGTGPGILFTPYRRAFQTLTGATRGFAKLIFGRQTSYPGLLTILNRFYRSIAAGTAPPISPQSIIDTVDLCERIGAALDSASASRRMRPACGCVQLEGTLPPLNPRDRWSCSPVAPVCSVERCQ